MKGISVIITPTRLWVPADPVDHRRSGFRFVVRLSRPVKPLEFLPFLRRSVAHFRHGGGIVPVGGALGSRLRPPGEADDGQVPVSAEDTAEGHRIRRARGTRKNLL